MVFPRAAPCPPSCPQGCSSCPAFLSRSSSRGRSQTVRGVGSIPPPPHQLCLKGRAGIRKRDGLFSEIPQRVCSLALFKNRYFHQKATGRGGEESEAGCLGGAVGAVPPPHTPGSEILPDAPRAVVLARLHEHRGGHGAASRGPSRLCTQRDPAGRLLVFSPLPSCTLFEGRDVSAQVPCLSLCCTFLLTGPTRGRERSALGALAHSYSCALLPQD